MSVSPGDLQGKAIRKVCLGGLVRGEGGTHGGSLLEMNVRVTHESVQHSQDFFLGATEGGQKDPHGFYQDNMGDPQRSTVLLESLSGGGLGRMVLFQKSNQNVGVNGAHV